MSIQRDTKRARASPHGRRAMCGSCDFGGFLVLRPMSRSSRNRLKAVVDLIFDALPDLVGAHVRSFQYLVDQRFPNQWSQPVRLTAHLRVSAVEVVFLRDVPRDVVELEIDLPLHSAALGLLFGFQPGL